MIKTKFFYLFLSIAFYIFALLMIGLTPLYVINRHFWIFGEPFFSIICSIISYVFLIKIIEIKNMFIKFLVLFIMTYLALVLGANPIHDYILERLLLFFEEKGMANSKESLKLWDLWSNDLSRNLMYFFGLLYSLFSTGLTFLSMYIINKIKQKKKG